MEATRKTREKSVGSFRELSLSKDESVSCYRMRTMVLAFEPRTVYLVPMSHTFVRRRDITGDANAAFL
jgi:hypothetical protein